MCHSMRQNGKRSAAPRRGIAIVWTAITLVVFIGMAGLVCDFGYVILVGTQLQSAADAAALAGAFRLGPHYTEQAVRDTATAVAEKNNAAKAPVDLEDGDIVIGVYDPGSGTVTPDLVSPDAVKITARRTGAGALPLVFAPLFGVSTANVQRTAIASIDPGIRAGVAILNWHANDALHVSGNPTITVRGGDVVVNSDHRNAVGANGNPTIDADSLRIMPRVTVPGALGDTRVRRMQDPLADPLADKDEPDLVNMTPQPIYRTYEAGLFVGDHSTLTINQPGIYVVGGNGITLHAGGTLRADGVMFYLIGSATVTIGSHANLELTPPTAGYYEDISIWQARNNTSKADFGGGGTIDVHGIIYMRDARLEYSGNSDTFGIQLIVDTLELRGTASIGMDFGGVSNPWACLVR